MNIQYIHLSDTHISSDFSLHPIGALMDAGGVSPNAAFSNLLSYIKGEFSELDFMLISGDLAHDGAIESYRILKDALEDLEIPVYFCLGNHDNRTNFRKVFPALSYSGKFPNCNAPLYYETIIGKTGIRLITLDSSRDGDIAGELCRQQLKWLANVVKNKTDNKTIVMLHHPPFIGKDIDSLLYQLNNSPELSRILCNADISGIFSGHTHNNYIYDFCGIPSYVADSTAFGLKFTHTYSTANDICGFNHVTISADNICVRRFFAPRTEVSVKKSYYELFGWKGDGYEL